MKTIRFVLSFFLIALVISCERGKEPEVIYPENYRSFTHTKSMLIQEGHPLYEAFGGIHHIYANDIALAYLKNPADLDEFPDGAVFVFDLLHTREQNSALVEGERKVLGVMEKNSAVYDETSGWGYEAFKGDTRERMVENPQDQCHSCHEKQAQNDFVYSEYRE